MSHTVVTGASGMLGNAVFRELLARERRVTGWSHRIPGTPDGHEFVQTDLRTVVLADLQRLSRRDRVDLIVHCAALTDADYCEANPALAHGMNSLVPELLAKAASGLGAKFVYVSTDAVYGGDQVLRHKEDDRLLPASVYARTKLEGEGRVLAAYPEALVARTTMFGWTLPDAPRPKFAEEILGALTAQREISLWSDAIFTPLHVGDLAEILLNLAELDLSGVLNVGAAYPISKADFGQTIATYFGLNGSLIKKTSVDDANLPATRPKNAGLNVIRLTQLMGRPPSVEQGVSRLHREAYDGTALTTRGRTEYP